MKRYIAALSMVALLVAAACSPQETSDYDWCYVFRFNQVLPSPGVNVVAGSHAPGYGLTTDGAGMLSFNYTADNTVQPSYVEIIADRPAGVVGEIDVTAAANVFGINLPPGKITVDPELLTVTIPLSPLNAGSIGNSFNISIQANQQIYIRTMAVYGELSNPFGIDNCNPTQTPTSTTTTIPATSTPAASNTAGPSPTATPLCGLTSYLGGSGLNGLSYKVNEPFSTTQYDSGNDWLQNVSQAYATGAYVTVYLDLPQNWSSVEVLYDFLATRFSFSAGFFYRRSPGASYTQLVSHDGVTSASTGMVLTPANVGAQAGYLEFQVVIANLNVNTGYIRLKSVQICGPFVSPTPSPTRTRTATAVTPTRTSTRTLIPIIASPTITGLATTSPSPSPPTPTATSTPVTPTRTPQATLATLTAFPTWTLTATGTATPNPSATPTGTWIPEPTPTPGGGGLPLTAIELIDSILDAIGGENGIGQLFQSLANIVVGIFNILIDFIEWLWRFASGGVLFAAALIAVGGQHFVNFLRILYSILFTTVGFIQFIVFMIGLLAQIVQMLLAIIFNLIALAIQWTFQIAAELAGIYVAWNNAAPTPIPGMPLCSSQPLNNQICAVWYVLQNTLFSGSVGGILLPVTLVILNFVLILLAILAVRLLLLKISEALET
ncbi:MAG: hypothetical protein SF162_01225 [bacterium]|nr:hypothetical protein [bacterium]